MRRLLVLFIRCYQNSKNHIFANAKPMCRFYPTCSNYAIQAIKRFGAFRGSVLFFFRFIRCNPLFKGGYDPVPEKGTNWFLK